MDRSTDLWTFGRGDNFQLQEYLGAHKETRGEQEGYAFRVWAPNAQAVDLIGDFTDWEARKIPMVRNEGGVWEVFCTDAKEGDIYKYLVTRNNGHQVQKIDPLALWMEKRPNTGSIIKTIPEKNWKDGLWRARRKKLGFKERPVNIYEVHAGSWKRNDDYSSYTFKQLKEELIPYLVEMNYTHVEFMPVMAHPLGLSWGYQLMGYFALEQTYGSPEEFQDFVEECHLNNIGVIVDWVPGHFCKDAHGLYRFDGSACYEYEDQNLGENEWGTANFNVSRNEVRSFLVSNLYFWIKEFHIDGVRMDAISNMIYHKDGVSENRASIEFLQYLNQSLHENHPDIMLVAEDSSAWPLVTKYQADGGLGFDFKWNMGWMNDTLKYIEQDPFFRKSHHGKLTFSFMYAFSENFVLPLSHDEIVHGKNAILNKMPGYYEDKLAHVKNLYSYQMAHPGKKLNFMGNEFVQGLEWRYYEQLEWQLLKDNKGSKDIQKYVKALNALYLEEEALWHDGQNAFEWIEHENIDENMLIFLRKNPDTDDFVIAVFNFSGKDHDKYPVGVNLEGEYECILDSNEKRFGGSYQGRKRNYKTIKRAWNNREQCIEVKIAKNSTIFLKHKKGNEED